MFIVIICTVSSIEKIKHRICNPGITAGSITGRVVISSWQLILDIESNGHNFVSHGWLKKSCGVSSHLWKNWWSLVSYPWKLVRWTAWQNMTEKMFISALNHKQTFCTQILLQVILGLFRSYVNINISK